MMTERPTDRRTDQPTERLIEKQSMRLQTGKFSQNGLVEIREWRRFFSFS